MSILNCRPAIGKRPTVELSSLQQCTSYRNGWSFSFPGGLSVGTIAPADIPEVSRLRVAFHLPKKKTFVLVSRSFEIHSPKLQNALIDAARIEDFGKDIDTSLFNETGLIRNTGNREQMIRFSVFDISSLPDTFLLRMPALKVGGVPFWVNDVAFSYFPSKNGFGLCAHA